MKQAELQHYRAMLQAQAVEPPPRRGLFGGRTEPVLPSHGRQTEPELPPTPSRRKAAGPLFGRRHAEPPEGAAEPLVLDTPVAPTPASVGPRVPLAAAHFSETPYHAEDLADAPSALSVTPGVIAGWSAAKPLSAETRLLRRLSAVLQAEHQGLAARLNAAAG